MDIYAPAIALGQSVGRIGCFAAGCDYGKLTTSGWGLVFTNPYSHEVSGVPLGVPLYPTQPIMSLASLTLFVILMWRYSKKTRDGEIFVLYLGLYAVTRFCIEFLRGDEDRGFVFHHLLSTSQFIAILAFATAAVLALIVYRRPALARGASAVPAWGEKDRKLKDVNAGDARAASTAAKVAVMPRAPKRIR